MSATTMTTKAPSPGLKLAIDYGPLIVFFTITFLAPGEPLRRLVALSSIRLSHLAQVETLLIARVIVATAAFMLATVAAMVVSRVKLGSISPMLWISGVLVVVFGGLTIWFRDPTFIKMKPTFVYAIFAGVLAFGLWSGRPLLQLLLGSAYPGLSEDGWGKLTRNWAVFFMVMAALNEIVWRTTEATMTPDAAFRAWTLYKMPGCVILTLIFAFANVPMLLRHGLQAADAAETVPPEG